MKNLLNIFNPSVSKTDRKGVDSWLGTWITSLRNQGEIKVTLEKNDVQQSIYHGSLALSIIMEAFAHQYGASMKQVMPKLRRERLKAVPYAGIDDEPDELLLGLSMINTDSSTWFIDESYRDLVYQVVDEYGMDEAVVAMSTVAQHLHRMLTSKHSRIDVLDIAIRVGDTFVTATSSDAAQGKSS
ncbi:hypothetical protein GCM10009720_16070 [Yaniella flava]|uniref:Uncharacterized protein n=1 Tax=Yaniella flava TaxID=287930 RepID=A0ABP5FXX5_9MICC|nr:hypothetical protein [Micrococcaceae bacterium]